MNQHSNVRCTYVDGSALDVWQILAKMKCECQDRVANATEIFIQLCIVTYTTYTHRQANPIMKIDRKEAFSAWLEISEWEIFSWQTKNVINFLHIKV